MDMVNTNDAALVTKLEGLKSRLASLNTLRTRLETQIEAARKEHARLSAEAQDQFGTADVAELESKLAEIRQQNQQAVTSFEQALNQYDAALAAVAQQVGG